MRILMIVLSIIFITYLSATIINIPADQPTIQEGINVAVEGDTILVQPGEYYENINYNGQNVVVASMFLTTQDSSYIEQTIINGSQEGSVVMFESGETPSAVLSGFTITNGSGFIMPNDVHCGGGIFCHLDSDPTIINCIVTQNNAGDGGGIFCYMHSDATIIDVEISYNSTYDDGGGLHCNWGSNPTLERVRIIGNYCADKGAGICCGHNEHSTDLTLNEVLICHNTSGEKGSAIYMVDSSSYFDNITICDNSTNSNYWGSIYCEDAYINLNNGIIWNNQNSGFNFYNGGYADVTYSNTQDYFVGEGNIYQDPYFINPTIGNYNLQETSPCIDAGDPTSPFDPDGTITDMGAYYYNQGTITENNTIQLTEFMLTNYPNPFNPTTTISFSILDESNVELSIYNIKGQKIKSLLCNQIAAGEHSIVWNGDNDSGKKVGSSVYLYKLNVDDKTEAVKKCMLLK